MDYCDGCFSYVYSVSRGKILYCSFKEYNEEGQCPCTTCVVKVMCEHACNDYHVFRNNAVRRGAKV